MKKLIIQNSSYKVLLLAFRDWLDILGYAATTVQTLPTYLQEFFYYLEQHNVNDLDCISIATINNYYRYLTERTNITKGGGLSNSYLNKHQYALHKFRMYLKQHKSSSGFRVHLKSERRNEYVPDVLTTTEVKSLFEASDNYGAHEHTRLRDKAILVLLYSCGLRRNEASKLDLKDIFYGKELLHVRAAKNRKERLVPINGYNLELLEAYIYDGRPLFKNADKTEALLIGQTGDRLLGGGLNDRIKFIQKAATDINLQEKKVTAHLLRHSIATHLLAQGMKIEDIQTFLGHSSLESTQIYTHIINTK